MLARFVHCADLHLDSPLNSLALRNAEAAERVGAATRRAFERIVDLCLDEGVDGLLIAGDLVDGDWRSMKTAGFLSSQLHRLSAAGCPVFIIKGNHDASSKILKTLSLPAGVHVFDRSLRSVPVLEGAVVVHGVSFAKPSAPDSLLPLYPAPAPDAVNIGLMHTSLDGAPGHDVYAPCALRDLLAHGFDYWGLGHIHQRTVHAERPALVVMPGTPQGRHVNEAGAKSVTLLSIADDRGLHQAERAVAPVEFARVAVDLSGLEERGALRGRVEAALGQALDSAKAETLIARLTLTGATACARGLMAHRAVISAEIEEIAAELGDVLLDGVSLEASEPERTRGPGDALAELAVLLETEVTDEPGMREKARAAILELRKTLPREAKAALDDDRLDALVSGYLRDGARELLARIADA